MWSKLFFLFLAFVPVFVHSLAATDEIQDADNAQSGYMDNHNMHPATVGSSIFGILWKNTYGAKEKWYAKPLVYTPPGSSQIVFLASSMNVLRILDAVNGTLLNSRTVQPPFLQSDIGCTDIPDYIGITGTPIIDPNTNTAYFFSKGYKNGASNGGVANGIYRFYAVDIRTLADKPGFPILIDGHYADNDNTRYFIGGTVLQRPSLSLINGAVIGAFGGHCDLFNYTGMLVAVSTTSGVGVTSLYAMESSPGAPAVVSDITVQQGGKAGIWQGGMGLASDGSRVFLATGNGLGHANGDVAASGRTPLSTLDEVVANFAISSTGKITLSDYFEPYEYVSMDAGDRDLGSGGVALLDSTVFSGTGVSKMAMSIGKNGKAYILNANNLGGFKQGSGGVDNIIQTIIGQGSVFGGAGSYPLEGGYIYFTPVGYPTVAYKMGLDSAGAPYFTQVGQTAANSAGRVGIGIPTVTTYKGQAGTGILWVSDPAAGLQAYNAVPVNGILTKLTIPATGGLNKFQRPAFGDGRLYVSDTNGNVICMGSPVALPLQCSQPVDFGSLTIGDTSTVIINCTALIAITSINGCTTGDATWQCSNSTLPKGALAKGATFSFPVTWNLTQASINNAQNASYGKVLPGVDSTSLDIYTTNAVTQYSNILPISLSGTTVSKTAYLTITPPAVDLGGVVVGSQAAVSGLSASVILSNVGADTLTFLGSAWTASIDTTQGKIITYHNITNGNFGASFSSTNLPKVGDTIAPGASLTIPVQFISNITGAYSTFVQWWTTGGSSDVMLTASASTAPLANISVSTIEGGWDYSEPVVMDFGDVLAGTTVSRNIRVCNAGGSALLITKSKPPIDTELLAPNSNVDLHEGQSIDVNSCALGQVSIVAAPLGVDRLAHTVSDVWILNTDDVTFGVHDVQVTANIVTRQVGPLLANGSSEYLYLGCYYDGGGRQLSKQYNNATNENGWCQNTCFAAGYKFAGTEYHTQCWCGNTAPSYTKFTADSLKKCAFSCPGDVSQACGGDGTYISIYYDRTKYVPGPDSIPGSSSSSSSSSVVSSTTSLSSRTGSSSSVSISVSSSSSSLSVSSTRSSTSSSSISSLLSSTTSLSTSSVSNTVSTSASGSSTLSSTSSSASTKPTGPAIVKNAGNFAYIGCYTEATNARALTGLVYANDNMTIEICAATCATFTYFGVEYHRECYCGNTLGTGSVQTADSGCLDTCTANSFEYCGGASKLSMYQVKAAGSSSSSSSVSLSAASSSSSRVSSSSSVLSSVSSLSSSSMSQPSSSLPASLSSGSSSSASSLSSSSSQTISTSSSVLSSPSTTTTSQTTTLLTSSSSPSPTVLTFRGFAYSGCYSDPAGGPYGGHNMPKLFSNDSMTPDLCISSALARLSATPATTYLYAGVEYGRECYAGSVAPTPEPTSLVGAKACTMTCAGDKSQKCGAGNMYNLYVATSVTVTGTASGHWSSVAPTSTIG
ncbi:WSC-domain-containing protein [Mollisia scopiformis]|uniref:WSC-domain-containing protein n=1 Tax=Mollisia scopiformis TaxID=149040 RepID=A0A194XT10_MOLSC|nr:WSC-domain-containing protein [Mollisia scopiformis]KUJ23286.1 WSC-domain-containing protein [Mollisia scopiformis]